MNMICLTTPLSCFQTLFWLRGHNGREQPNAASKVENADGFSCHMDTLVIHIIVVSFVEQRPQALLTMLAPRRFVMIEIPGMCGNDASPLSGSETHEDGSSLKYQLISGCPGR